MIRLFIDTSGDNLSLLIKDGMKTAAYLNISCGRRMSEILSASFDFVLKTACFEITDINEFYAVTGPGSFTGVRIGIAYVLGLSVGCGKRAYGLTSLDCIALSCGLNHVKTASRLKGDIFAVREYDFEKGVYGVLGCQPIIEKDLENYKLVNTDGNYFIDLEKTVSDDVFLGFRGDCSPLYMRKSEAEINLDTKRDTGRY